MKLFYLFCKTINNNNIVLDYIYNKKFKINTIPGKKDIEMVYYIILLKNTLYIHRTICFSVVFYANI